MKKKNKQKKTGIILLITTALLGVAFYFGVTNLGTPQWALGANNLKAD